MDALNLSSELVCLMNWRYKLLVSFNREGNWDPEEWNDESKNHKMCMWWSRCKSKARVVDFCAISLKTQQKYISVNDPEWLGHSLLLYVWGPGIFQRKLKSSLIMDGYLELKLIDTQIVWSWKNGIEWSEKLCVWILIAEAMGKRRTWQSQRASWKRRGSSWTLTGE